MLGLLLNERDFSIEKRRMSTVLQQELDCVRDTQRYMQVGWELMRLFTTSYQAASITVQDYPQLLC